MLTDLNPTIKANLDINTGIDTQSREAIALGLSELLADTYTLYLKTHNFHWNVTGPLFYSLHQLFEGQYTEMAQAVDEIAERIRALGAFAPGTYTEFSRLSSISEPKGVLGAEEMIRQLVEGQEAVIRTARSLLSRASEAQDEVTLDLITERLRVHEKNAWMLRSLLAG